MSYYRIQEAGRDASALLNPGNWVSEVWNKDAGTACERCQGAGGWDWGECEACGGKGTVYPQAKRGVSACRTLSDLARYADYERGAAMDVRDCVVVEMDGELSDDEDEDASYGAVLVLPSAILSVTPAGDVEELAELVALNEEIR